MQENDHFNLILDCNLYEIPSHLNYLSDINQDIYTILITKHEYFVKSSVHTNTFKQFIKYLEKREIPDICPENIDQYEELSQEFEIMDNVIQLFKKNTLSDAKYSLLGENYNLKNKISANKELLKTKSIEHGQIIDLLFKKTEFNNKSEFLDIKKELIKVCNQKNIKFVDLLTNTIIKSDNDLLFSLNIEEKTATLLRNISENREIYIPRAINYESEEYIITSIIEKSFSNSRKIKSIQFEENCEIKLIDNFSFAFSSLENITIPSSVTKIGDYAFYICLNLQKVLFSEKSKLESIGKFAFSKTSLKSITIPSHVTEICDSAFSDCYKFEEIHFSNNSELRFIKSKAFNFTVLRSLTIPPSVNQIGKDSFAFCKQLDEIKFLDSCSIERETFNYCFAKSIQLPSNMVLKQRWCEGMIYLKSISIIEKEQKNIQLFENKFILGKSDLKSDIFDVILFANRNVKEVVIPSFIKRIAADSFSNCKEIEKFEFENDSQLEFIDESAFSDASIENIIIPPHVKLIGSSVFNGESICSVKFSENSEFYSFDYYTFSWSSITSLSIPSSMYKFNTGWCCGTEFLTDINIFPNKNIENIIYFDNKFILGKSDLSSNVFDILIFARRNIKDVTIPSFIKIIENYSFDCCKKINFVNFEENSQLKTIEESAFSSSSIEKIILPPSLIEIKRDCFSYCDSLKECVLPENSELISIEKSIFDYSTIETLSIPSSISRINKEWCNVTRNLININVFLNKNKQNILNFENKLILSKSNQLNDIFDVIIFGRRNLTEIIIPSFIKRIENYAFSDCKLYKVTFSENSQLVSIGKNSFKNAIIKRIFIPDCTEKIEDYAFSDCQRLENVVFSDKSSLISIANYAFGSTSLKSFYVPPHLRNIDCLSCVNVKIVEIDENSELISINKNCFNKITNTMVMIPVKLKDLIFFDDEIYYGDF